MQTKFESTKCLTQNRSPKMSSRTSVVKQIAQLIKNSKDRNTERTINQKKTQIHSTTSRVTDPRNTSITFHQLLQEYRNHKTLNKENSTNKINKPKTRQISFPNTLNLNQSNSRTRIKDSLYQTKKPDQKNQILSKISNIAEAQNSQINYCLENMEGVQKSIEKMCRLSQEQLNLLNLAKEELVKPEQAFRKSSQRCVSADIQISFKSPNKKSRSTSQDYKESKGCGSTLTNSNPKDLDLTCDENTIIINTEERVITEVDPLIQLERQYIPDPYYLSNQTEITSMMRAILIDWMMEVCMEFQLKRQTFHLAVSYIDNYLSKKQATKLNLQLLGLTSLFISCKIEEIYPRKVSDFEKAADFGYTSQQILDMELIMLRGLKWHVNPPTFTYWVNWFTDQWDIYANNKGVNYLFRKPDEESYQLFRKLNQFIDCAIMDINTLQYLPRTIVASMMYLLIGFEMNIFNDSMVKQISQTSLFLLDQHSLINQLFGQFVKTSFGFALQDLLPAIQYCVGFISLEINFDTPPGVVSLQNTSLENHYEEFLSFQCYTKNNIAFIRHRPKE
ncbi:G1/S-specific cyclin-E1 [Paramecium bursaria]